MLILPVMEQFKGDPRVYEAFTTIVDSINSISRQVGIDAWPSQQRFTDRIGPRTTVSRIPDNRPITERVNPNPFFNTDGRLVSRALNKATQTFNTDIVFSSLDNDTVQWTSGMIAFDDGTTIQIEAGDTGDMTELTYIFFDTGTSGNSFETTTDITRTQGDAVVLFAVGKNTAGSTEDAFFVPAVGVFGLNSDVMGANSITEVVIADDSISAPKIQANAVIAGKINANAVTAGTVAALAITAGTIAANVVTIVELNVATLSSITANIGSINSGSITGVTITGGTIRTSASGARVELDSAQDDLRFYGTSGGAGAILDLLSSPDGFDFTFGNYPVKLKTTSPNGKITLFGAGIGVLECTGSFVKIFIADLDLTGNDIINVGQIELDSLIKDGAGSIDVFDNFEMTSNGIFNCAAITPPGDNQGQCGTSGLTFALGGFTSIVDCVSITPTSNNVGTIGTAALTYLTGYLLNVICGSLTADNGTNIVVDDHLDPNSDNSFRLGHNGGNAARWSNISAVLTDFGDIGLHNGWKFREWPCTAKDVQKKQPAWFRKNANQGIQILNEDEELVAVIHRDGYVYCKGFRPLEDLPV